MRLAVTGFVSEEAGSVASANALLLLELLSAGHHIAFFSKSSFVDPRPLIKDHLSPNFEFVEVDNRLTDRLRRAVGGWSAPRLVFEQLDARCYNKLLARRISQHHRRTPFDAALWMGDYARGRSRGLPNISYAQGPPGTDARSILRRQTEIRHLVPPFEAWKWCQLARFRLSPLGRPPLHFSDRILVGSRQSAQTLEKLYGVRSDKIDCLPYPIDLQHFNPQERSLGQKLRVLWLGRIIPRKRLDLFLDGAVHALRRGLPLSLTVVGSCGMVRGYERLLENFAFPEALDWVPSVDRAEVPRLLSGHDVLVQPSEEENFGSSVAEAQACGLPVIVGSTNGNRDYLCERDAVLTEDTPEALSAALNQIAGRLKGENTQTSVQLSRRFAESVFSPAIVAGQLIRSLQSALESLNHES